MQQWWRVIFKSPDGRKKQLRVEEVADAVAKAKELRAQGFEVSVISGAQAFPPKEKHGPRPSSKHYWCPYCIKWQVFRVMAIRSKGLLGPEDLRCPACTISDHDYYIRLYNGTMGTADMEMVYRLENAWKK